MLEVRNPHVSNVLNLIFGELQPGVGTKINGLQLLENCSGKVVTGNWPFASLRSWTMPGFFKAAAIVMSGGAIVGTGVLATLPGGLPSRPLSAAGQIADLAPVPCEQQLWLNADRTCQTWTAPHRDVQRVLLPGTTAEPAPDPLAAPATSTRLTADDSAAKPRVRASRTAEAARIARGENVSRRMRVASRAANSTQPGFFFWPTSQQDTYRQRSARRSGDMTRMFAFFGSPTR